MISQMPKLLDFAVKTFIVVFAIYLAVSALFTSFFVSIYRIFDRVDNVIIRVDNLLAAVEPKISRLDGYIKLLASDDLESRGNEELSNAVFRLYGTTNNPEVHYQIALWKEKKGDLVGAVKEMSLAVGLVAPDKNKYLAKLQELKAKVAPIKKGG